MATPEFIVKLREKIGHEPLWLPGITAVVLHDTGTRVLLGKRADTGGWRLVTGILEPGEEPAAGTIREVFEETGVVVAVERLLSVEAIDPNTYPNGDQCSFLDLAFRCRVISGEPRVNDDECTQVDWFALDALPADLPERQLATIRRAQLDTKET